MTAFNTPEKSDRYRTEHFTGAVGLNWYTTDPTLQTTLAYYLPPEQVAVAEPHLTAIGELMGGPVARWAEETDRHPPTLERYDRWGHDVSRVVMPASFTQSKRAVLDAQHRLRDDVRAAGGRSAIPMYVANYLLDQADIGMGCALGTGGGMVQALVAAYAPADVRDHVLAKFASGEWDGETAQMLTERTGGSDLGALETTATRHGDAWLLNGVKWFASNCDGQAFVVLAKPEGAPDNSRGVATFLVLRTRRDGSRNGVRIRRLKDKLGTRSVASGEVEFADAEAFLLSGEPSSEAGPSDGKGLGRMMELTNAARLGIALFALGNARRALVESLCYARRRQAFGSALIDKPLMRRKLAEMIVDVEAAQALVFDGTGRANHRQPGRIRQRIAVPVTKLKVCRLGITMASDAIEIHGGNGYIEDWPVARLLRDAQVNTIWEGPDNILCLDVRRGIEKARAHEDLLARLQGAVSVSDDDATTGLVARRVSDLEAAVSAWTKLDGAIAEARLFPLAQFMADVYAGVLLTEQAAWERAERGDERKALVASLYAKRYLADRGPLRGIDDDGDEAIERFDELVAGAFTG
ncbi:DNA alkylation response protein [Mycobacterium sp. 852013-51886_SCH5428379]|uniref:acyl-CoA dehydrogenase family protein n=1 Tax=Mycobacterium sp. 852013-51886_SCH5428379 TaxID=1834111 RepID=UPI0007FE2E53|nr:acyl-CoA dehydrogenase family protein [Mycobacterium sp. 852013-51886_SCH5428379]OBB57992.1 DNA alkylation response protein [Mycobacterium sp. 852013-51886_SCH5428379]